ncbi:hypothetical protein AGABI1DRAFT_126978 [Agaricus bisporus var. burnettii JB137-S8]|uniref:Uncharacterized protein n=2 Tax=Agaricus bisporus var. burnettii TaxID=192524 RepID=K5XCR1_AGABU|nr:uncharacterized protein AGABI1DRAFT_126978 [Agaricus bisporus var. burnettii JB137-S8]EKM80922.1 hypothetical protein AGABI1DRAFT_126978 [Agaricus bisporus var. burnettii JB137-S8]KAF7762502.1 hypothetical protein Agabi119p4_9095 [Agaricus bisporus var. burnettii]
MSSATPSVSHSSTPLPTQGPPKTYEDLLDAFLNEASDDDNTEDVFGTGVEADLEPGSDQDNSANVSSPPALLQDETDSANNMHSLTTPQIHKGTRIIVQRAARRAKLEPYQVAEADTFIRSSINTQLGLIFVGVQAMRNEVNRVLIHQPRFTVDEALHKTISAYSLGVLLSEKLREYKRSSTDVVLAIIRNNNANIPSNLDQDPYALSIVKAAISDALTQARSRIKKLIGKSIDDNLSIYQLSSKVIEGSQCTVSVPLCARLAVLRDVYSKSGSGLSYWNDVDSCLAHCRAKAKDNADGIRKILAKMLKLDRSLYGYTDKTTIPKHVSVFQQAIDDSL